MAGKQRLPITPAQVRLIHTAKRALSLDDDTYRDILEAAAGVRSCKDLDRAGVEKVLRRFKDLGFRTRTYPSREDRPKAPRGPRPANVYTLMSQEQNLKIGHLKQDLRLTWHGYRRLCFRTIGRGRPATVQEAQKMIEAMKAMIRRQTL